MKRLSDQRGFSLIETLAATLILAVAFLGLAGTHVISSKAHSLGNNQGLGILLAEEHLERMRRSPWAGITTTAVSENRQGETFVLLRIVNNIGRSKEVNVATVWDDRFGVHIVTLATLISRVTNP